MYRLLIAEDDFGIREAVKEFFIKRDFDITEAANGIEALDRLQEKEFDVILLDVMMPEMDGFQVCRALRRTTDIPVIFITARTAEEDQLTGFQLDADDYVMKPFSLPVLHAKVIALIKRSRGIMQGNLLESNGIRLNIEKHEVKIHGKTVDMPPKVYSLLVYFMENPNRILTRDQILDHVWGEDAFCYDRAVDTTVKKLRNLLGDRAGCIKTIIKVGYKYEVKGHE